LILPRIYATERPSCGSARHSTCRRSHLVGLLPICATPSRRFSSCDAAAGEPPTHALLSMQILGDANPKKQRPSPYRHTEAVTQRDELLLALGVLHLRQHGLHAAPVALYLRETPPRAKWRAVRGLRHGGAAWVGHPALWYRTAGVARLGTALTPTNPNREPVSVWTPPRAPASCSRRMLSPREKRSRAG
jgi:hypothetical protein